MGQAFAGVHRRRLPDAEIDPEGRWSSLRVVHNLLREIVIAESADELKHKVSFCELKICFC